MNAPKKESKATRGGSLSRSRAKRRTRDKSQVTTPSADVVGNALTGAVLGSVIAGPLGAIAGGVIGAGVEKGPTAKRKRSDSSPKPPPEGNAGSDRKKEIRAGKGASRRT